MKKLLDDLNLSVYFDNGNVVPLDLWKNRVTKKAHTDWLHHCETKPKLRTYRTFKESLEVASHISCNMPKYDRSLISQLRLGILPLRIETGRYSNIPEADRICLLCNGNHVENEVHFLFKCEFYNLERTQLETALGVPLINLTDIEKFNLVFEHPFSLGKYVRSAFRKRRINCINLIDKLFV